jgi:hypothetical protein
MTTGFQGYIRRHTGTVRKELTKECVQTIRCNVAYCAVRSRNEIDIFALVYNRRGGGDAVWDVTGRFGQGKDFCVWKTCLWWNSCPMTPLSFCTKAQPIAGFGNV